VVFTERHGKAVRRRLKNTPAGFQRRMIKTFLSVVGAITILLILLLVWIF
jgi:hypothetical protein